MNFAEMMARAAAAGAAADKQSEALAIMPEAAIMRLREAAACYAEQLCGPRFKVGDVVVLRPDGDISYGGPCVVVETRAAEPHFLEGKLAVSNASGRRLDTRIVALRNGSHLTCMWTESYTLDLYTGEGL